MWTGRPIIEEIGLRFQLSLQVAIMATLTAIALAIPLGTISAVKQNTWIDYVVRAFSIAGVAMPSFWLGILIILGILITSKAWFGTPWMPPITYVPIWVDPLHNLSMLIWPALATGYRYSAVATRMTRSAMLEVLREDYVRTARAKGLFQKLVVHRHALRNALLPVDHHHRHRVRLPDGRPRRHRAGVQSQRARQAVRRVGANHDYNMTQALVMLVVRHLRPHQPGGRHRLRVARSAHPLQPLTGAAMAILSRSAARRRPRAAAALAAGRAVAVLRAESARRRRRRSS